MYRPTSPPLTHPTIPPPHAGTLSLRFDINSARHARKMDLQAVEQEIKVSVGYVHVHKNMSRLRNLT